MKHKNLITIAALLTAAPLCRASLLSYEGFNYASGSQSALGGGTGWSGNWHLDTGTANNATLNISAGMTQGDLVTSGNSLSNTGAIAFRALDAAAAAAVANESTTNGEVWISFLGQQPSGTFGGITLWNAGSTAFADSNANYNVVLGRNFTNVNWSWSDMTAVGNGDLSGISAATQVLYVMRFDYQATQTAVDFYLFTGVNPDTTPLLSEAAYSKTGTLIADGSGNRPTFDRIRTSGNVMKLDEIRIGTTQADVITAVPEPSTYGLMGAGALAAAAFVRRRRKKN